MSEEDHTEELVCQCCGRSYEMIDILNTYFGKHLSIMHVGNYEESLCTKCIKELRQITFDQVFYGSGRCKMSDLQDKCISILFNRDHDDVEKDIALCQLLKFFQSKLEGLKQKRFKLPEIHQYFKLASLEWNQVNRFKCAVALEDVPGPSISLVVYVRMLLTTSLSEGFAISITMGESNTTKDEFIIPFKID